MNKNKNKYGRALEGWGFDMKALRESEGAFSPLSTEGRTRISNKVLNRTSIHTANLCHYSGLRSTSDYKEESV